MDRKTETSKKTPDAFDPLAAFRPLTPISWMGTAWFENLASLGNEITSFVAERIKEDVQTQHALLHCKSISEAQRLQAQFMQKAFDQYQVETGKLIEMSGEMAVKARPNSTSKD
ncbi:phasin family protein [Falsihalocynthiibacter sp. S25ZX9]|uniref:phasin family protein n=1 Tax=unclassified Falsihalocynthiibacter TaxID=2854191 RepID=UPI003510072E